MSLIKVSIKSDGKWKWNECEYNVQYNSNVNNRCIEMSCNKNILPH